MLFVRTKTRLLKWNYFFVHPFLATSVDTFVQVACVKSKRRRCRPRTWYFLISITRNLNFFQYSVFFVAAECEVNWNGWKTKVENLQEFICCSTDWTLLPPLCERVEWWMKIDTFFLLLSTLKLGKLQIVHWSNSRRFWVLDQLKIKLKTFRLFYFFIFCAPPWPRGRKINTCKFVRGHSHHLADLRWAWRNVYIFFGTGASAIRFNDDDVVAVKKKNL